ncbi:hypothetical protein PRZ48_008125 [Zasmidium cellare]|uniref:Heterokaryon incompatibility domain-containing protein n=1 Tax=Zasmidium cellare TaxID=395010 RepID=A0ABR0EEL2_ZASCE|nr:hypothetical protein PRZ48_008125 [Zasmidium cellare]
MAKSGKFSQHADGDAISMRWDLPPHRRHDLMDKADRLKAIGWPLAPRVVCNAMYYLCTTCYEFEDAVHTVTVKSVYSPLSDDGSEIRILTLFPGTWSEDIQCELTTESLDDPDLVYHALSYAWGHHSDLSAIIVSGRVVTITPSLEAALRHVRQEDQPLTLWIDKLCINQKDDVEKAQQVALMHRLGAAEPLVEAAEKHELLRRWSTRSTNAVESVLSTICGCYNGRGKKKDYGMPLPTVLAWSMLIAADKLLSTDDAHEDDPFAIIMHFAQDKHISALPCFFRNMFGQLYFRETAHFHRQWLLFRHLLSMPWHTRLWTVQEAMLVTNAWVIYGRHRIPFSTIRTALLNQRRHLYTCCSKVEKLFPSTYAFVPDAVYTAPAPRGDVDRLLRMYRCKGCGDARDKVFGIAALMESGRGVEVDYGRSVREVYTEAMSLIISQCEGDLRCLTGQGFSSSTQNLPSWVRDLSLRPRIESVHAEMRRLDAYDLYNASANIPGAEVTLKNTHLHLSGIKISTITQLCTPLDLPIEQCDARYVLRVLLSWRRAAQNAGHNIPLLLPDVRKQNQAPFWRTILGDLIWDSPSMNFRRFRPDEDAWAYTTWLRKILLQSVLFVRPTLEDGFVQAVLGACFGRALFVTGTGRLGLVCADASVGDQVWVLRGGRVPFVLRGKGEGYGLVGDCYLNGGMDEEGVDGGVGVKEVTIC